VNRITIGVVGDGSAGKDALMQAVFGIDSKIDPVAGSTDTALRYPLNAGGSATIINYPGFNDFRPAVDAHTNDYLHHTDVFVMVVDINRGISGTDIKILEKVKAFQRPILICLNKVDLLRSEEDEVKLEKAAEIRLPGYKLIKTAFDPDPRLGQKVRGVIETYTWIRNEIDDGVKNLDANNFPEPPKD
jgi:GTPase Era involved in 16S rRNA processing